MSGDAVAGFEGRLATTGMDNVRQSGAGTEDRVPPRRTARSGCHGFADDGFRVPVVSLFVLLFAPLFVPCFAVCFRLCFA